jgi:hypothetical protein
MRKEVAMAERPKNGLDADVKGMYDALHFDHQALSNGKPLNLEEFQVVTAAYCANGHSLINDLATFNGFNGITVTLRDENNTGQLSLSPIIGDLSRTFFNFKGAKGDLIDICCPTCNESLPVRLWRLSGRPFHQAEKGFCQLHRHLPAHRLPPFQDYQQL